MGKQIPPREAHMNTPPPQPKPMKLRYQALCTGKPSQLPLPVLFLPGTKVRQAAQEVLVPTQAQDQSKGQSCFLWLEANWDCLPKATRLPITSNWASRLHCIETPNANPS
ncbi:hypothetical protein SDJN02_07944, partial [Cucurbita argyrosperma subsp. argyrosperma]